MNEEHFGRKSCAVLALAALLLGAAATAVQPAAEDTEAAEADAVELARGQNGA